MRRLGIIAGIVFLLLAAAGAFFGGQILKRIRAVPDKPVDVALSWGEVRTLPGHVRHLDQEVPCQSCHLLPPERPGKQAIAPCEGCHPTSGRPLHLFPTSVGSPECWDCHRFEPPEENAPWTCESCHAPNGRAHVMVSVHAQEFCGNCHDPHQDTILADAGCIGCHISWTARHGKRDAVAKETCVECHGGHLAVSEVPGRCQSCHFEAEPKVSPLAVFTQPGAPEQGHTECTSCHQPHPSRGPAMASCQSCHSGHEALAAKRVKEHRDCKSCHDPHQVARAADSCLGCHDKVVLSHKPTGAEDRCVDCHAAHPDPRRIATKDEACDRCHEEVRGKTPAHAERADCTGCHAPHDFRSLTTQDLDCGKCHDLQARGTHGSGHADCRSCHGGPAHALEPAPACGQCHESVTNTAPRGHLLCADCHRPHERGVRKDAPCAGCHEIPARGAHGKLDPTCKDCHQPHADAPGPAQVPGCESCHGAKKPPRGLHKAQGHAVPCVDCHAGHQTFVSDERARCLSCHEEQVTHEPAAARCGGCHPFK